MASEYVTFEDLVRFHKEVIIPDLDMRFGRMDARFDRLEKRADHVDERLDRIEVRLDRIDARLDDHDTRFVNIAHAILVVSDGLERLTNQVAENHRDVLAHFDSVYTRLDTLATDHEETKKRTSALERAVFGK